MPYTIQVFTNQKRKTDNKNKAYEVHVDTLEQAETHAKMIMKCGYRRQIDATTFDWFPPQTIRKIRISGPDVKQGYNDTDITT